MRPALRQPTAQYQHAFPQPSQQFCPRAEIYAPVLAGGDFARMRLHVEKIVAHARGNAQARGAAADCAVVFSEDALLPYKASLSAAKSFADSISSILPKDQFFAVCFNVCASDGRATASNEGFLATSQGSQNSPKRAYADLDRNLLVEIFGNCDFRLMEKHLRRREGKVEAEGLTFCEASVRAGVCGMHRGCACYEMTKDWLERARKLDGAAFLSAIGPGSMRFEYCVCRDSAFIAKEERPTITLVSAHGLDMRSRQSLSGLRFLMAINDSYEGRNLLVESGWETKSGCRFGQAYHGCELVAVC